MAADDYIDEKVGVAVAASAAVFSPKVRNLLHRGAVVGVSGVLIATDMVAGFLRGLWSGVKSPDGAAAEEEVAEERRAASPREEGNGAQTTRRRKRPAGAGVP
jgi:hypothetical protein